MRNYLAFFCLATYLVSWFTKVHSAQKGAWFSIFYGWEAFRVGLGPIWPGLKVVTSWSEGKPWENGYTFLVGIIPSFLSVPSALTNGWMLLFALALITKKIESWRSVLVSGFVFCFCLNLFWFLSPLGLGLHEAKTKLSGLRAGYYLWILSFALAAIALMPSKESFSNFSYEILRRILLPATLAGIVFAGLFRVMDLERVLQKEVKAWKEEEKQSSNPPQYRSVPLAELTPIPDKSEKISTPFLVMLDEKIKTNPSDPEPLLQRAYLHAVWGNEADCRKDFQQALLLSTNRPDVYWNMGWALLNLGRFQDAQEAWSKAWTPKEGEPEPRWVPSAMAMACWKAGKKNEALAWYQRAAEREPASFTSLAGLKERISNWNTKEQAWLIEVHDAWQRTYLGRSSGDILTRRLSGKDSNAPCSTCR